MNRQFLVILLVAVIAVTACAAVAQAEVKKGEIMFGPYGLFYLPTDDYPSPVMDDVPYVDMGSDIEPGPGLAGAIDRMLTDRLSVGGEFKVYFGTFDESVLQDFLDFHSAPYEGLDEAELTWRTVHFGARARYFLQPESSINPFLQAGAGLYVSKLKAEFRQVRNSGTTNDYARSESFTDLGVSFGPGVLVRVSPTVRLSLDAIFNNVFTADRNVRYLSASAGLIFSVTPE